MEIDQIRQKAQDIVERAKSDPTFRHQLLQDPRGTVISYCLPEIAVNDFLSQANLSEQGDVAGYIGCQVSILPIQGFESTSPRCDSKAVDCITGSGLC